MKKITVLALAAGAMFSMGSMPAIAQDSALTAEFTMKTSFYVGGAKMPPGSYSFRQSQDDPAIFFVSNSAGTHQVDVVGRQSSKASKSGTQVIFNRYPSGEYLTGVETASGTSVVLDTGAAERLAAKKGTPQSHTVPAK
jgi:hypothetical protein